MPEPTSACDECGLRLREILLGLLRAAVQVEGLRQRPEGVRGASPSACKTVVNQRLSLGGMRWGEEGSDAVAHLRGLYRSDPEHWEALWGNAMAG